MQSISPQTETVDIVYFSWTGNTKKVVEIIFQELSGSADINVIEIKPKRNYPYLIWLFLSFIPGVGTAIQYEDLNSHVLVLCMPKWTVNCPPITSFLRKANLKDKIVALVITYGGFDEVRYTESYKNKIKKLCKEVKGVLLVKRNRIALDKGKIREWVKNVLKKS